MLLRLAVLILAVVFIFLLKPYDETLNIVTSLLLIGGCAYFIKERDAKASSFNFLTLLLALAVLVLGYFKGIGYPGLFSLALAVAFSFTLDLNPKGATRFFISLPFWFFTAWAVGEIFASKYGKWGFLLSLVIIPIYLRDVMRKRGKGEEQIQKTE